MSRPPAQGGGTTVRAPPGTQHSASLKAITARQLQALVRQRAHELRSRPSKRELQPHFLTAADMAEPARPRSSASITGMNSKSALSQRKRGSATAGIFEASSKFTTI